MVNAHAKCRECGNIVPFEEYHDFPRADGTVICVSCEKQKTGARWGKHLSDSPIETLFWNAAKDVIVGIVFHYKVGQLTVDFAIPDQKIAIELDGKQHKRQEHIDRWRDRSLLAQGWLVIRFDGRDTYTPELASRCVDEVIRIAARACNNSNITQRLETRIEILQSLIREAQDLLNEAVKQNENPFLFEVDVARIDDWIKRAMIT